MNSGEYRLAAVLCHKKKDDTECVVHHYPFSDSGSKRREGLQWRVLIDERRTTAVIVQLASIARMLMS